MGEAGKNKRNSHDKNGSGHMASLSGEGNTEMSGPWQTTCTCFI